METKTTPVHPLLVGTTPGPWKESYDNVHAVNTPEDGGDVICEAPEWADDSMKRWKANAKLIAQAPSLAAENALLADRLKEVEEVVDRLKKQVELCDYRDGLDHELRMNAAYLDLITIQFPTP